jgi:hypothetical protein
MYNGAKNFGEYLDKNLFKKLLTKKEIEVL